MNPEVTSKLPELAPSIFTVMSRLAHEHKAINLSQGFPNFNPDPELIELVSRAMKEGYNQYAPMAGIYSLRRAISEKVQACYDYTYDPASEITLTAGATQAIFSAISAFVCPGDEVIILKPAYDCYEPAIAASGGRAIAVQMEGKDYRINWEKFRSALSSRTRMVVINSPHNPSGKMFSRTDMSELQTSLANTDVVVLSDEVYEHIIFDGAEHQSVCRFPELAGRSLICVSFGKTYHATGWKLGYCLAPEPLMKAFQKIHEYNVYSVNHPMQRAFSTYLEEPGNYLGLGKFFQEKRDLFLDAISGSRFKFKPAEGTYFQLLDYSEISDMPDLEFARKLTVDHGLASIPVSVFNTAGVDYNHLRFCFAKTEVTLMAAAKILNAI